MKLAKTLGLAALAAIIATAIVGASSATAESEHLEIVLCEKAELVCESPYPNPTEIHLEALAPVKLLTSLGTMDCERSLIRVTLLNKLAKLVEGHLLALTLEECSRLKLFGGKEACTVTVNSLGGLSLTPAATKLLAEAKLIELLGKTTKATVECGSIINCTYEASEATQLTVHSDEAGHLLLLADKTPLKGTGGLCPETVQWDAVYHAVTLEEGLPLQLGLYIEL